MTLGMFINAQPFYRSVDIHNIIQIGCKTNVNKPKIIKIPTKFDPDLSNKEELILQFYSFGMRILNFPLHELFSKKMCEIL